MRLSQIQGIVNDLLDFRGYENPLSRIWLDNKFEINLVNGKISYLGEDSITEFYKNKRKWFIGRIKKLGGNVNDFQEAKIIVFGAKEKILIKYKNKIFEGEKFYEDNIGKDIRKLREDIKKLKPIDIPKNKK